MAQWNQGCSSGRHCVQTTSTINQSEFDSDWTSRSHLNDHTLPWSPNSRSINKSKGLLPPQLVRLAPRQSFQCRCSTGKFECWVVQQIHQLRVGDARARFAQRPTNQLCNLFGNSSMWIQAVMFKRQILHGHWGSEKSFKGWNPGLCAYICCTRVGGLCLDLRHCSVHALTQGLYGQCPLLFLLLFRSFRLTYYHPLSLNLIITILLIITLHYIITYYISYIFCIIYTIYIYIYYAGCRAW